MQPRAGMEPHKPGDRESRENKDNLDQRSLRRRHPTHAHTRLLHPHSNSQILDEYKRSKMPKSKSQINLFANTMPALAPPLG